METMVLETTKPTKKRTVYFGRDVQDAIIRYNILEIEKTGTIEKSKLFNNTIYPAFLKLTENIINTWKFHRYETTFSDLQRDAVAFMFTKMPGYDEDKGRAYSYFTIVCKNFLIHKSQVLYEASKTRFELDVVDSERNIGTEISLTDYQETLRDFMIKWCDWCDQNLEKLFKSKRDRRIADSLLEIFRNSEDIDIHNKKLLYILVRERASVETQHITKVVRIFKDLFTDMFSDYRKHGFIDAKKYL
jgi:hypothetical protein